MIWIQEFHKYLQLIMERVHVCRSSGYSLRFIGQESVSDTLVQINKLYIFMSAVHVVDDDVYPFLSSFLPFAYSIFIYSVSRLAAVLLQPTSESNRNKKKRTPPRLFWIGAQFELVFPPSFRPSNGPIIYVFFPSLVCCSVSPFLLLVNVLLDWLQ